MITFRSFLSELAGIISGGTDETVEGLLQRYDVDVSDIPDENTWSVEPPFVPEPEILEPEPGMYVVLLLKADIVFIFPRSQ